MLGRKGMSMNHKKLCRLYREEGLSGCRRLGCKCTPGQSDTGTGDISS